MDNNIILKCINDNLIENIWNETKPRKHDNKIYKHDIKYSGEDSINKIIRIRQIINNLKKSLSIQKLNYLIVDLPSICWTLNLRGSDIA